MPQTWIAPQSNSLMDTFAQAEAFKAQRAQNAFNEAKIAELPYEREREQALNEANIAKAGAQTEQAKATTQGAQLENTLKTVQLTSQLLSQARDEGSYQFAVKKAASYGLDTSNMPPSYDPAQLEQIKMAGVKVEDQIKARLEEQKFTEQQKQSGIDNQFQQANLGVAQGHLGVSQANAAESARHHGVMENKPASGFSMSYDAEGRPIMSYGPGAKLTEGQSKATVNAAGAEVGNTELSDLKAEGFDPTSASGGLNTWAAGKPGLNLLASEEGQRQHAANIGFAQAVNYQRSGAATPEVEYLRAVDSMMDRYGDKPAATAYKKRMRDSMIQAVRAGGGAQVDQIVGQILTNNRATGGGAGSVSNRTQTASPQAPSAAQIPAVRSDADYDQLPSGARFTDPQGRIRVKP